MDELWSRLKAWYAGFEAQRNWLLVRRNIDREFHLRQDLEFSVKRAFLEALATKYEALDREAEPGTIHPLKFDPPRLMAEVAGTKFFLKGGPLGPQPDPLCRYIPLKNALRNLRIPKTPATGVLDADPRLEELARQISLGHISGAHLKGALGRPGYPFWCTTDRLIDEPSPGVVRDRLGLQHVDGGWLLEIRYSQGVVLRAPTVLDALAGRDDNWVFLKSREPGGPGWGCTLDLRVRGGQRGVPEAVHDAIEVPSEAEKKFSLRAIGDLRSTRAVDFDEILANLEL